jgi:hypothetical protein
MNTTYKPQENLTPNEINRPAGGASPWFPLSRKAAEKISPVDGPAGAYIPPATIERDTSLIARDSNVIRRNAT